MRNDGNKHSSESEWGCCKWGIQGLAFGVMAYTRATRKARASAREAQLAQRRQRLADIKSEFRLLLEFMAARRRLTEVDVWLDERIAALHTTADVRRVTHRQEAANALADMIARGMTVDEIARMAGMTAQTVNGYLTRGT